MEGTHPACFCNPQTWPGRMVCLFLCVVGIALYAIPIGTLFDSFGAVLGMGGDEEEEEEEGEE